MTKNNLNISLDRALWNSLAKSAHERSLYGGERFSTIKALRWAVRVFVRLEPVEIEDVLKREPFRYPL